MVFPGTTTCRVMASFYNFMSFICFSTYCIFIYLFIFCLAKKCVCVCGGGGMASLAPSRRAPVNVVA